MLFKLQECRSLPCMHCKRALNGKGSIRAVRNSLSDVRLGKVQGQEELTLPSTPSSLLKSCFRLMKDSSSKHFTTRYAAPSSYKGFLPATTTALMPHSRAASTLCMQQLLSHPHQQMQQLTKQPGAAMPSTEHPAFMK